MSLKKQISVRLIANLLYIVVFEANGNILGYPNQNIKLVLGIHLVNLLVVSNLVVAGKQERTRPNSCIVTILGLLGQPYKYSEKENPGLTSHTLPENI